MAMGAIVGVILILGNAHVDTDTLLSNMRGCQSLDVCERILLGEYHARGFLDAKVNSISKMHADLSETDFVFHIDEGAIYRKSDGHIVNLVDEQRHADEMLAPLREQGYAYAKATPRIHFVDRARHVISVDYAIEQGNRIHIRRLELLGHTRTRRSIILRELSGLEDTMYRTSTLRDARDRLMRLGYFSRVEMQLIPTGTEGEVDLRVIVVEQPTWMLAVMPMLDVNEGVIMGGLVGDRNCFGTGVTGALSFQISSLRQVFELSAADTNWHANIHRRQLRYPAFLSTRSGVFANYRFAIGENWNLGVKWNFDYVQIDQLGAWRHALGPSVGFNHDAKRWSAALELGVLYGGKWIGSQVDLVELSLEAKLKWRPLSWMDVTNRTKVGVLLQPADRPLWPADRYFLGGQGSVRGYIPRSIGDGTKELIESVEMVVPFWRRYNLSGYVFADAGTVDLSNWIVSYGTGLQVMMMNMPFRLELAIPTASSLARRSFDIFVGFSGSL